MGGHRSWRRLLGLGLVAGCLVSGPGCLSFTHSIASPHPDTLLPCQDLPQPCRSHVFVFLIHSVDPLDCANLSGVRDYLIDLGFIKTYYGQVYHTGWFEKEIRRICKEDPDARFVLIGYGVGAHKARSLAEAVQDEAIGIDLVVYLSGGSHLGDRPANVRRVVNISAEGKGGHLDGADNIRVVDMKHYGTPTHGATLDVLAWELTVIAGTVPVPARPIPATPPTFEQGPTPRPVTQQVTAERDEWDFLKPATHLSSGARVALPAAAPKVATEQAVTTEEP